jgi:isopentenyl diphosphate isomerase/L-lactate dehydrogenase-like FMN-dependent dehydrogenase
MQKMCHPDGEIGTAKASVRLNSLMTLSTISTTSIEDVGKCLGDKPHWMQLYVVKDRDLTLSIIRKAEKAGFTGLAVTVDAPVLGNREADHKNEFHLPKGLELPNIPSISQDIGKNSKKNFSQLNHFVSTQFDQTLSWETIKWIQKQTKLKIIVKGIVTYEDAVLAAEHGVDGIWVSNHGARQLDTSVSTIQALPEVVKAVRDSKANIEVYLDGGIRRGTDVIKALALGATAVFVGRPVLWGLTCNGEQGVVDVIETLNSELSRGMALCGCTNIKSITPNLIFNQHSRL